MTGNPRARGPIALGEGNWAGLRRSIYIAAAVLLLLAGRPAFAGAPHTNPMNLDPAVREAWDHFYVQDYDQAIARFERYHEAHPGDPYPTAMLLNAVIFAELYRKDLLDTTFYANDGFLTGRHATEEDPKVRDRVFALSDEVVNEANWRLERNSRDVDALYARGWARALRCAYVAMVERAYGTGFRLATKARDDHARILEIDPQYTDAKLVVGVYEYVVGSLPLPFKLLIGFAGITGSKSRGLALLADAGEHGVATRFEARTCTALFLRREARYKEAIEQIVAMKRVYPHGFLFGLEEANLRKDDGQGMEAVNSYREIVANNNRAGFYPEARMELAWFGLGEALRGQRHYAEAAEAYERSAQSTKIGPELKIRSWLAAGECRDLNQERAAALRDYQAAIDAGPATSRADQARRRMRAPYRGN